MTIVGTNLAAAVGEIAPPVEVQRLAFYLESQSQFIFAWLHYRELSPHCGQGVVICPPIGYEQIHSHRSLRHLADAFARAGYPALRFDYHGTGDSAGSDENDGRYQMWQANIHDAIVWMQRQLGCKKIHLAGLRIGASLAAQVASEQAVDSLILWSPVVKGRSYVRESKALSMTASVPSDTPGTSLDRSGDIEAAGFVLSKQTADDLSQMDLLKSHPQCRHVLILARDDMQEDQRLLEHLQTSGIQAEQATLHSYGGMMAEPHFTKVPQNAIRHTVDWLTAKSPLEPAHSGDIHERTLALSEALQTHPQYNPVQTFSQLSICERIYQIQQIPDLFGIVTDPESEPNLELPLILLINAGSVHHIGPHRLYVILARKLAAMGFRCLRMDMGGLGDSIAANPDCENLPYAATALGDINLTLEKLQTDFGVKKVVLMGLCSGAYFAFQSAVQLAHPLLAESVMINPLTFYWKEGMSLETAPARQHMLFHYYWETALQPQKWLRLLSGNSQTGIVQAMKILAQRWKLKYQSRRNAAGNGSDLNSPVSLAHPLREDLPGDLDRAVNAGRHLSFFFSKSDPGYSILQFYAKRKLRKLKRARRVSLFFIDHADHTFSSRGPRQTIVNAISDYLFQRYHSENE